MISVWTLTKFSFKAMEVIHIPVTYKKWNMGTKSTSPTCFKKTRNNFKRPMTFNSALFICTETWTYITAYFKTVLTILVVLLDSFGQKSFLLRRWSWSRRLLRVGPEKISNENRNLNKGCAKQFTFNNVVWVVGKFFFKYHLMN